MKELDALIKALEENGTIDALKRTVSAVPMPPDVKTEEEKQTLVDKAVKGCLQYYFEDNENEELDDLLFDYLWEIGLNELVKALNIQPSKRTGKDFLEIIESIIDELIEGREK